MVEFKLNSDEADEPPPDECEENSQPVSVSLENQLLGYQTKLSYLTLYLSDIVKREGNYKLPVWEEEVKPVEREEEKEKEYPLPPLKYLLPGEVQEEELDSSEEDSPASLGDYLFDYAFGDNHLSEETSTLATGQDDGDLKALQAHSVYTQYRALKQENDAIRQMRKAA